MPEAVLVYVDTREPKSMFDALSQLEGIRPVWQALEAGDYYIPGDKCSLLIERKTTTDYLNSLFDSHLWSEIEKLKSVSVGEGKIVPLLLVEGSWGYALKWRKRQDRGAIASIYGSLLSTIAGWGVHVIHSPATSWTPYVIASLARWVGRPRESSPPVRKPKAETLDEMALRVLCSLPHISTKRARDILSRFGSVWDALSNLDRWDEIEGIGEKIVSDVRAVLTHRVQVSAGPKANR